MTQLSIALYSRGIAGSYHWALVVSSGVPSLAGEVDIFQITDAIVGQPKAKGVWRLDPRTGLDLWGSTQPIGCVLLPTAQDAAVEALRDFINQYGAAQEDYNLPPNIAWSCARWCIRILEDLIDGEMVTADKKVLYSRTLAHGLELAAGQGDSTTGIPVINF